jgi:hypothetical protein
MNVSTWQRKRRKEFLEEQNEYGRWTKRDVMMLQIGPDVCGNVANVVQPSNPVGNEWKCVGWGPV